MRYEWIGRGHLDIGPFGYAHHKERDEIRDYLRRKYGYPERGYDARLEAHCNRIQFRLRKYRPTLRQRQETARAALPPPAGVDVDFSWAELERMVEHFAGSNDEVGQAIADKARKALAHRG